MPSYTLRCCRPDPRRSSYRWRGCSIPTCSLPAGSSGTGWLGRARPRQRGSRRFCTSPRTVRRLKPVRCRRAIHLPRSSTRRWRSPDRSDTRRPDSSTLPRTEFLRRRSLHPSRARHPPAQSRRSIQSDLTGSCSRCATPTHLRASPNLPPHRARSTRSPWRASRRSRRRSPRETLRPA